MFGCQAGLAAGICRQKDNKKISPVVSRAFGPKTESLICFLYMNCSNS